MGFQPLVTASLSPEGPSGERPSLSQKGQGKQASICLEKQKRLGHSLLPGLTDRSGLAFWAKWEGRNVCGQPLPGRSHLCPAVWGLEI